MKTKSALLMLLAILCAGAVSATTVGLGFNQVLKWAAVTTANDPYPLTIPMSVSNGLNVGTFDLVLDTQVSGATVGLTTTADKRLGIISPEGNGTNTTIDVSEVLYLTVTNISLNITNLQFTTIGTYLLTSVGSESITLHDGDLNSQVINGGANQATAVIDVSLQPVSLAGETFFIETASNSAWYVNWLRFEVGVEASSLPSNSATVVDFSWSDGNLAAAGVDVVSTNEQVWYFDDVNPLWNGASGTNTIVYGGATLSWAAAETNATYSPNFRYNLDQIQVQINPPDQSANAAQGMYIWKQEDFLNGGSSSNISLVNGGKLLLNLSQASFDGSVRFVVEQDGQYYVSSSASSAAGEFSIDPRAATWAPVSSTNGIYTIGAYGSPVLDKVTAFGMYFDISRSGLQILCSINAFEITAELTEGPPPVPPVVGPLSISSIGSSQLVVSWQAGASGTHTLQAKQNLVFGTWSNVVDIIPGVETTLSVTTTATAAESFYRVIAE